jgi:diaminopimelate epimerase
MQALGNDFIVLDGERLLQTVSTSELLAHWQEVLPVLAKKLCSRRFGIGGDGLILALDLKHKPQAAIAHQIYGSTRDDCELAWTYTNSDGSASRTCGNGLRCLALWAHNKGLI